jgi:uncharacterized protein YjbJ (UPF0337 family)
MHCRNDSTPKAVACLFAAEKKNSHGLAPMTRDSVIMKSSTKDKIAGKTEKVKGAVEEKVGRATNNPEMEDRGTVRKVGGAVRDKVGDIKKVFEK